MKKDEKAKNQHSPAPQETAEQVTLSRQEYDDLLKRIAELEGMKDRLQLAAADFENAKRRLTRERDDFVRFGQENLVRDILPVMDNFERALAHAGETSEKNLKSIVTGVEMVLKQLSEILKSQGLKRLKTVGEKFDPHIHEAIGFVYDEGPEDVIVEEIQAGYQLHDRLLRAAKVRVRMVPSQPSAESEEKSEEIT